MTVLDVLMSRVDAFLYVGAILAFLGFLVGVVATLVLTATVRGHGYFHIMLEQEAARARNEREEFVDNARASQQLTDERVASLHDARLRDIQADRLADLLSRDDDFIDDVEPESNSWCGDDPWVTVVDAVAADENFVEIGIGENYIIPAEAATAVEPEDPKVFFWGDELLTTSEWKDRVVKELISANLRK
jgi:hypothetical protein